MCESGGLQCAIELRRWNLFAFTPHYVHRRNIFNGNLIGKGIKKYKLSFCLITPGHSNMYRLKLHQLWHSLIAEAYIWHCMVGFDRTGNTILNVSTE